MKPSDPSQKRAVGACPPRPEDAPGGIPRFALYGERAMPGQEMLHIEAVHARSRAVQWEIRPHLHQGLYQALWLAAGEAVVMLDEQRETVCGPSAIVVPPGVVHGFRFSPDTDGLVLTMSARFLVEGEFQAVGDAFRVLFTAPGVLHFADEEAVAKRLGSLFGELAAEFAWPSSTESPVVRWLARSVVWRLAQAREQGARSDVHARGHGHQALFSRFLLLVEAHYLEHWSLDRYAGRLGLSAQRLNRIVRAESGRSALELVHERLTREACRRLIYVEAPVASLAGDLGFADPAYFSRFFKRRMGSSPHRYRQRYRLQS